MAGAVKAPPPTTNGSPPPLTVPAPREGRAQRRYLARFGVAYVLLAAILAAVGFGAWWLLERDGGGSAVGPSGEVTGPNAWADFAPTNAGLLGAQEIAFHVQRQFRLPSGKEPVAVLAFRPSIQGGSSRVPIQAAVVAPESARKSKDYAVVPIADDLQFTLCGGGPNCSIAEGRPSAERARWLRRQAIELALYAFHYNADVNRVLVFMPGSAPEAQPQLDITPLQQQLQALATQGDASALLLGLVTQVQSILLQMLQNTQSASAATPSYAMLFERQQLQGELAKPLDRTLPQQDRYSVEDAMDPDLAELLDDIAAPSFFTYDIQQAGDGTALVYLTPQHL